MTLDKKKRAMASKMGGSQEVNDLTKFGKKMFPNNSTQEVTRKDIKKMGNRIKKDEGI